MSLKVTKIYFKIFKLSIVRNSTFIFLGLCVFLFMCSCSKNDRSPEPEIKSPVGTWILVRSGVQAGDGTNVNWVWRDIKPGEAFKVTFKEDNSFISYEKKPPYIGTYTFSDDAVRVFLPDDTETFPTGRTMAGELENNIITLRYLVGDDGAKGLQFRFFNQN